MNALIEEIKKPLTERQPWPWEFVKEASCPWQRIAGNVTTMVVTRYEAQKIQALEDQPRLLAEIERLEKLREGLSELLIAYRTGTCPKESTFKKIQENERP